jgi:TolB-like protein
MFESKLFCISLVFFFITIGWCDASNQSDKFKKPDHRIERNTYINTTHNCQVSVFLDNWKIGLQDEEIGDGHSIAEFDESVYGAWGLLAVSRFPQGSLEEFAQKGTYEGEIAKYTFLAGKPAYFESKHVEKIGFKITSKVYKFVNNGIGYIFSFSFLSKYDYDEELQKQIDQILNSFTLLNEQQAVRDIFSGLKARKARLTNVALVDMIDLSTNNQSEITKILTNELQSELTKTRQFEFIERRNIEQLLDEQKFQLTGLVSEESAVKIGNILGANYIINSNIGIIDETSVIYAQITNAENGKIISSASIRCRKCSNEMLMDNVPSLVSRLLFEQ